MIIAAHHRPGTREHDLSELIHPSPAYEPSCAWPDDCMVQWGHGIIPAVSFFEAFPKGTFIRGEGETIADAERAAFAKFERDQACDHVWGRQRPGPRGSLYTNGAGWCRKCGGFRGQMFKPIFQLGEWRKPLTAWEADWLAELEGPRDPAFEAHMERVDPGHRKATDKSKRLLRIRLNLFGKLPAVPRGEV